MQAGTNLAKPQDNPHLTPSSHSYGVWKAGGRWTRSPVSREAAERLPKARAQVAAARMAVVSLHTYLRHWLGLTPGLTRALSSMAPSIAAGRPQAVCGAKNRNQSLWHLVLTCGLVSAGEGSCRGMEAAAQLGGCGRGKAARAAEASALLSWARPGTQAAPCSSATTGRPRSHHHVLTADYP